LKCRVCENDVRNLEHSVSEFGYSFGGIFQYLECGKCGCLQLVNIPGDMRKYYPSDYYSFINNRDGQLKKWILRKRASYAFFKKDVFGRIVNYIFPELTLEVFANFLKRDQISLDSKILDVGCGNGRLLYSLKELGFSRLYGVDPYLPPEVNEIGLKISKRDILKLPWNTKFDLIMFIHSFEHIPNQLQCLLQIKKLLSNKGLCLIRMPVKTEYIWKKYGVDWAQIDAPRHFFLHTFRSFNILLQRAEMNLDHVVFDSTASQFFNNEQRVKRKFSGTKGTSILSPQILVFRKYAAILNSIEQGDQASFVLNN